MEYAARATPCTVKARGSACLLGIPEPLLMLMSRGTASVSCPAGATAAGSKGSRVELSYRTTWIIVEDGDGVWVPCGTYDGREASDFGVWPILTLSYRAATKAKQLQHECPSSHVQLSSPAHPIQSFSVPTTSEPPTPCLSSERGVGARDDRVSSHCLQISFYSNCFQRKPKPPSRPGKVAAASIPRPASSLERVDTTLLSSGPWSQGEGATMLTRARTTGTTIIFSSPPLVVRHPAVLLIVVISSHGLHS